MSEHYVECRALPTINETFPQFSTRPPPPQQQQQQPQLLQHSQQQQHHHPHLPSTTSTLTSGLSRNNLIISPLDLSLRAGVNIVPITPPSTPSPPRKRPRFMSDEQYLWRPHVMGTTVVPESTNTSTTSSTEHHNFLHTMTYTRREDLSTTAYGMNEETYQTTEETILTARNSESFNIDNNREIINNFGEITKSQRSGSATTIEEYQRQHHNHHTLLQHRPVQQQQQDHHHQQQRREDMTTIYVDDETIVLTEDEDDEDDDGEDEEENEEDEENETLLSSQELNEDDETNEPSHKSPQSPLSSQHENLNSQTQDTSNIETYEKDDDEQAEEEEEEYVDILGNDDDDINPLSARAITMLRLQNQQELEQELEKSGNVLTRNKLIYENKELHNRAVDGLAKLFDRDFQKRQDEKDDNVEKGKTYIDLTNYQKNKQDSFTSSSTQSLQADKEQQYMISSHLSSNASRPYKTHKTERKRMKLRKHMSLDEETISPVSGTIIRKLRDDEELVVRKGDIDPAFNVVEVTEEAKAILASIDNKIGAYLCQLCRTLYDDAFKLAQHRCPRIVHIEYKCSECEKVSYEIVI